jgi:probable rRNA maturation factor
VPARFYEIDVRSGLKSKRKLSGFLDELLKTYVDIEKASLHYIFCNDAYLLSINRQFLDHDTLTDIITFDLSEAPGVLLGEIYISTERVAENAALFHTSYEQELHRVIFHGALHLCGFKDKTKAEQKKIRALEDQCLENYFNIKPAH